MTTKTRKIHRFLNEMALEEEQIRHRIREARKTAGLTQEQAADLHAVHKRTWENWENNYVPWDKLDDIAAKLGVQTEWLLHGDAFVPGPELRSLIGEALQAHDQSIRDELAALKETLLRLEEALTKKTQE